MAPEISVKKKKKQAQTDPIDDAKKTNRKKKQLAVAAECEAPANAIEDAKAASKKKRKLEAAGEGDAPIDATDHAKDAHSKKEKKAKKAKKAATGDSQAVDPADEKRRDAQRQIQQLVVKMRAEGKGKAEIEAAKRELKASLGSFQKPQNRKQRKLEKYKEYQQRNDVAQKEQAVKDLRKKRRHEVVVIPVIWRGRTDHKEILGAAEDIKSCLASVGLDAWIDSRRQYTPGQKFAHWEHRGVMLRVEVGPQDFASGVCQVCKATTPGDYESVQKKKARLPPSGARALLLALKEFGCKIDIERREGDSADEGEEAVVGKASVKASGGTRSIGTKAEKLQEAMDDLGGNWAPRENPKAAKKAKKAR